MSWPAGDYADPDEAAGRAEAQARIDRRHRRTPRERQRDADYDACILAGDGHVGRGVEGWLQENRTQPRDELTHRLAAVLRMDAGVCGRSLSAEDALAEAGRRVAAALGADAEEEPPTERPRVERFRLLDEAELEAQPPVRWRVEGILPDGALGAIVGPFDSYKSFVALDLAASVQAGAPFLGRFGTMQGPAVYVLGEGRGAFGRRLRAYKAHRRIAEPIGLRFLPHPVAFMDRTDTSRFIEALQALPVPPALVVVDTMARCLIGGEENSAKDVGLFVAGVDRVRERTGAAVLIVHHTGKGGDTRGSSALPGALDVQIATTADGEFLTVACAKMKDAERFTPVALRRRVIDLGDGTTSLVLVPVEDVEGAPRGLDAVPPSVRLVLGALITGPARPAAIGKTTNLPERTLFDALRQAKSWGFVAVQAGTYRLTPSGERLHG